MTTGVVWPHFTEGDHPSNWSARDLNFLVEQVRKLSNLSVGPGLAVEHTRSGVHLTTRAAAVAAAAVAGTATGTAYFRIVLESIFKLHQNPDTVLANPRAGDGWSEDLVRVAKPYDLRGTPFDGKTIEKRWVEPEGLAGIMTTRSFTYDYSECYMVRLEMREDDSGEVQSVTPGWYQGEVIVCQRGPTMIEGVEWADTTSRHWAKELGAA